MQGTIFTQPSRSISAYDFAMWTIAGSSAAIAGNPFASDFTIPAGYVATVTKIKWNNLPYAYVPPTVTLRMFAAINGTRTRSFPPNFAMGDMQGEWLDTFIRVDSGQILTLTFISTTTNIFVGNGLRWYIQGTLAIDTAAPLEAEFTNPVRTP